MVINIKGKEVELKYTFNSFMYMADLEIEGLAELQKKPFKAIPIIQMLLLGAVNSNPKIKFTEVDVQQFIEKYVEEGSLPDLLNELMDELQNSSFFKSLQKNQEKQE